MTDKVYYGLTLTNDVTGEARHCHGLRSSDGRWTLETPGPTFAARLTNADGSRSTLYALSFNGAKSRLRNRMADLCDCIPEGEAEEVMALAEDLNTETHCFSHMVRGRVFEVIAIEGDQE